jgi:hypothetical protein
MGEQGLGLEQDQAIGLDLRSKDHGHTNLAEMVKALDAVVELKKGKSDHLLRLR